MSNVKKKDDKAFVKLLRYTAVILSILSFLTTAAGMEALFGKVKAYMISFAIQALVLILGFKFFDILALVKQKGGTRSKAKLFSALYNVFFVLAFCSSSLFTYVFLSSTYYGQAKISAYYLEINQFLSEETNSLRDYNEVIGNKMIKQMRYYLLDFQEASITIKNQAEAEKTYFIKNAVEQAGLSQYSQTIDEDDLISRDKIDIFKERYQDDAWFVDVILQELEQYNLTFQVFKKDYDILLSRYNKIYNTICSESFDIKQANEISEEITKDIFILESRLTQLASILDVVQPINSVLNQVKSIIASKYNGLIQSLMELQIVCKQITDNYNDAIIMADVNLDYLTEILYSPETIHDEDIDKVIDNLKILVAYHLKTNSDHIDDTLLQEISSCVIYLKEYRRFWLLKQNIEAFEENNLRQHKQHYELRLDSPKGLKELNLFLSQISQFFELENKHSDQEKIHSDIEELIRLLKGMPNVELLVRYVSENSEKQLPVFSQDDLNHFKEYHQIALEKAFLMDREILANTNEIEQALLLLGSQHSSKAILCLVFALFLNSSSFGIDAFVFFYMKRRKKDTILYKHSEEVEDNYSEGLM